MNLAAKDDQKEDDQKSQSLKDAEEQNEDCVDGLP
jgi:hypothetical protein